jgi:hypothetical protein
MSYHEITAVNQATDGLSSQRDNRRVQVARNHLDVAEGEGDACRMESGGVVRMMYLDESGNHNLRRINSDYPIFVLGGVIVDRAYARNVVEPRVREFKERFFGRSDIILHTVDMIRSHNEFAILADVAVRDRFYEALNQLLQFLEYTVVACAIRLDDHVTVHGNDAADPYMYSLDVLVERFCEILGEELDSGFICAEMRSAGLDRDLRAAWQQLCVKGTDLMPASEIDSRIVHFTLKDKKPNIACMQLADLVVTPIGRAILGTLPHHRYQVRWEVIESKLHGVGGLYEGHGLVIRP